MAYDLLLKNGRVVDGSGMPSFFGDVAVNNGKIAAIGKAVPPHGSSTLMAWWYRQGLSTITVTMTPRCSGPAVQLFLLPRRHHRDHRQLLPGPGASAARH